MIFHLVKILDETKHLFGFNAIPMQPEFLYMVVRAWVPQL